MAQIARGENIANVIRPSVEAASVDRSVRDVEEDVQAISAAMASDPETVNATNQEAPHQSRITWGAVSALLLGIVALVRHILGEPFDFQTFDFARLFTEVGTVGGAAYVLFGRWVPGLKPLFWKGGQ